MAATYGEVKQLSFFIYSWKLPGGILPKSCYSEKFFEYGDNNYFYFRCFQIIEGIWELYLHTPSKDKVEFDIHIVIKYVYSGKDFSETYSSKNCLNGLIATVKGDLLEVVCTFSRVLESVDSSCKAEIWANFINVLIQKENFGQLQTYLKKTKEYWVKRKEGLTHLEKYIKENNGKWEKIEEYLKALQKGLQEANEKWIVEGKENIPRRVEEKIQLLSHQNEASIISKLDDWKQTKVLCDELVMVLKETNEKCVQTKECLQQETTKNLNGTTGVEALNENLRNLFLNEEESDVIFIVGDNKYPAHTKVIEKQSSVLQQMLKYDMKEKKIRCLNIPDCDPLLFRDFLFYLYTGNFDVSKENVFNMCSMSVIYDVIQLNVICMDYIKNNLSIDIICDVIVLANKYNDQDLLNRAINFFIPNAKDIFQTEKWLEFMKEYTVQANELTIKAFNEILATGGKVFEMIDISD